MTKLRVNVLLPRPFWTASNSETSIPNITLSSDVKHRSEETVYSNFMDRTLFQTTGFFLLFATITLCTVCTTISFGQSHNIADGKKVFADNHFRSFEEPGQSSKSETSAVFYGVHYHTLVDAPRAVQKNNGKNGPGLNPWIDPFTGSLGLTLNINL